jgi:hypothetical protein
MSLVEQISQKAAALPLEKQREVLDFVEFVAQHKQPSPQRPPFRSALGLLSGRNVKVSTEAIDEMRSEAWRNFPREEPN